MKILIHGLSETHGGVESFIMNYINHFSDQIEIHVVGNEKMVFQEEISKNGGTVHTITSRRDDYFQNKKEIDKLFSENDFDVVWSNLCTLSDITILKYAKKHKVKTRIIHSHNSQNMGGFLSKTFHKINLRKINKIATHYWACSPEAGAWMFDGIINVSDIKVINNAIDLNKYRYNPNIRTAVRNEHKWHDKFVIGHVGRFHKQKNHKFLIDIFECISKEINNAILILVGSGDLKLEVEKYALEVGVLDNIVFLGQRNDVNLLMQGFDRFLLPSIYEGLPFVLIESQASSLPSIASKNVISSKSQVSEYLKFVSLDSGIESWKNAVIDFDIKRDDNTVRIVKSGFEINNEARKIEEFFLRESLR